MVNTARKLEGRTAVITGGNSGIGLATARLFAQEGAGVVIFGRDHRTLSAAVNDIGAAATAVQGDVTNLADLDRLMSVTQQRHGQIDVLFANAGGSKVCSFADTDERDFDAIVSQNLKGTFFTVQKALPLFTRGAAVILTTSIASATASTSSAIYGACKAGIRSFARSFSAELLPRGIRVNALAPGPILTAGLARIGLTDNAIEVFREQRRKAVPMLRWGKPEEVAQCALFLASAESSFVAGIEIYVDGGIVEAS